MNIQRLRETNMLNKRMTMKGGLEVGTLEIVDELKNIIKMQADIIYNLAEQTEHSKTTGCCIVDNTSEDIFKAAEKLERVAENI